jgi:hypothetical protein
MLKDVITPLNALVDNALPLLLFEVLSEQRLSFLLGETTGQVGIILVENVLGSFRANFIPVFLPA